MKQVCSALQPDHHKPTAGAEGTCSPFANRSLSQLLQKEQRPRNVMKKQLILSVACLVASLAQAAPYLPEQLRLRVTVQPSSDLGIAGNTMYNPRFFDGKIYANQINNPLNTVTIPLSAGNAFFRLRKP